MPKRQPIHHGDDGWTRVGTGKGRPPVPSQSLPVLQKGVTVEKLQADYDKRMRTWQRSSCRKELGQILDRKQSDGGWQIEQAICMASGSFSRDNWEHSKRSMIQLVAFMDMVQHLQESSSAKIHVIAQEAVYTDEDVDFLSQKGVTVYQEPSLPGGRFTGPQAGDHLGPHSMLFEPFMDMDFHTMRQILSSGMKLYVGSSLQRFKSDRFRDQVDGLFGNPDTIEETQAVERFNADHGHYLFPPFDEDPNVFDGLSIYWKQPEDSDDES